ncbi:MAG: exosome complex protein Rrp42 [Candidatus Micrarchaeota archaeon]|nr:exosome complex protein Rrp42 [Candidatus Micrarchaeota archaeon]
MDSLNEIKRDSLSALLAAGKRADGRGMLDYRKIAIQPAPLQNAEGSAIAAIGKSQVMAGIKFDIAEPFADRPNEGVLSTSADLLPLASHLFESGPPGDDSIELARVVDRGIRSANVVDLESFFIEDGKVLALYLDIYVLDHDGNLIDCSALASMAALLSARMPKIEGGKIIRGEFSGKLKVNEKVVSCTFGKLGEKVFLDPSLDEEKGMDARLTLSTTPSHLCAAQKGGWGTFLEKDILDAFDIALQKGKELRALLPG